MKKMKLAENVLLDAALQLTRMTLEAKADVTYAIDDWAKQVRDAFQKNVELLQSGDEK